MALEASGKIINVLKKELGITENAVMIAALWEKEFWPLSGHVKVAGLKKGVLILEAPGPAYLQEIVLRRKEIQNKINQYFGTTKTVKAVKAVLSEQ